MPKITREAMRLYAVSDRSWLAPGESLAQAAETLLRSGVTCFQLREKELDRDAFLELALSIKPVCRRYNVPFLINDDVEVALACDADGVHVGQSDESLAQARRRLGPDKIIGVSCHNVAEARAALEGGADYLGCGSVFASGGTGPDPGGGGRTAHRGHRRPPPGKSALAAGLGRRRGSPGERSLCPPG